MHLPKLGIAQSADIITKADEMLIKQRNGMEDQVMTTEQDIVEKWDKALPGSVRAYYVRRDGVWVRKPMGSVRKPYFGQPLMPAQLRIIGQEVMPLDAQGNPDGRYPPSIRFVQAGYPKIGGGHLVTLAGGRERPLVGTMYVFASAPDERIVEMVFHPGDYKSPRYAVKRIADIMADGDELIAARIMSQGMETHMLPYFPMSDSLASFAAILE